MSKELGDDDCQKDREDNQKGINRFFPTHRGIEDKQKAKGKEEKIIK